MNRTKLDKEIDRMFVIHQQGMDFLEIIGKILDHPKTPQEIKDMINGELEKANDNFDKHTGLHETGKVGDWIKMEFDND